MLAQALEVRDAILNSGTLSVPAAAALPATQAAGIRPQPAISNSGKHDGQRLDIYWQHWL